jgi:hypothetical protein
VRLALHHPDLRQDGPMMEAPGTPEEEREKLIKDLRTATLSGGGLGLALLGVVAIPFLSILGLAASYAGWRSARPEYRTGQVFGIIGMLVALLGMGLLVVEFLAG